MHKISYGDINIGDFIKVSGQAHNTYEITSKSQKQICMRRMKDGMEHCMETERVIGMINENLEMNKHLIGTIRNVENLGGGEAEVAERY